MILLNLDTDDDSPLYLKIVNRLKTLIDNGTLKPGERIPSTREMSEKLQVNRSTVCRAYEELWVTGYIESMPGSYTYVRRRMAEPVRGAEYQKGIINWNLSIDEAFNRLYSGNVGKVESLRNLPPGCINMKAIFPDQRLFPVMEFKSAFNGAVKKYSSKIFTYCETRGFPPLREFLCERMKKHGIDVIPDEIIITNGAQNSLDLISRLLLKDGGVVASESPTYFHVYPFFRLNNCRVIEIPIESGGNYDFEPLKTGEKPGFFYTTPNFQNPTGMTMSQEDREALLAVCEERQIPILEDAFEEEMRYFGKSPLSIKALDRHKIVIYMGSVSKVLFPGIRIGWIAADRDFIDRVAVLKSCSDLSSGHIIQAALHEFCIRGDFDAHIKRLNRIYRKRMEILLECLKENIANENVTWTEPLGGYTLLMELKNSSLKLERMDELFMKKGAAILPGRDFYFYNTDKKNFRISIAELNEEEIETGVKRINEAIKEIYNNEHQQ